MVTGLHILDAAFAVASEGGLVAVAPSIVHIDASRPETLGTPALDIARITPHLVSSEHWAMLARHGIASNAETLAAIRAELRARVASLPSVNESANEFECAISAAFSADSLGVLLAVFQLEGLRIRGFHDAAALAVASLGLSETTLVLELGLSAVTVTRVEIHEGQARRRAAAIRRGAGLASLQQSWLRMISEAMVLQTRFDPLHEGASEQRLFDLLDAAAATAAAEGVVQIELPTAREPARITQTRDQFSEAAAPTYREIMGVLHELRPAGAKVNVLIDESLLRLPGLLMKLAEFRGCRLFSMTRGFVARAASLAGARHSSDATIESEPNDEPTAVTLHRGYAQGMPLENAIEIDLAAFSPPDRSPTHALFEGRAIALSTDAVVEIGRSPASGGIRLSEGLAGVSRLHCSLRTDRTGVSLTNHSSCGSWLNDEQVEARVRVRAGDRLRIGTPGVIIEFIAVGGSGSGTP